MFADDTTLTVLKTEVGLTENWISAETSNSRINQNYRGNTKQSVAKNQPY